MFYNEYVISFFAFSEFFILIILLRFFRKLITSKTEREKEVKDGNSYWSL